MAEWIEPSEWESCRAEILARGPVNRDFDAPKDQRWSLLTDRSKAWAKAYVAFGGDTRKANEVAQFQTPAPLTAKRFLQDETPPAIRMRTYIASLNDALKQALTQPEPIQATPAEAPITAEIVEQPPIYVPSLIPAEIIDTQEGERDTEKAKKVWRNAASTTLKDYIELLYDDKGKAVDWEWDLEAIRNAPAGVIRSLSKDGRGRTQVELSSALDAGKLLADHWKPKETETGRVDIRSVVVNILQAGDPSARYRLDQLAKEAAERLKADREKRQLAG